MRSRDLPPIKEEDLEQGRLLTTLRFLLELPPLELHETVQAAASSIADVLKCEKVDVFLLVDSKRTLHAVGTSRTSMGDLQRALGLDAVPLANGGSVARVFHSGHTELQADSLSDTEELRGLVSDLGVRSSLAVPFHVNGTRRGVLSAMSSRPDFFRDGDRQFFEALAPCMGMLVQRAEQARFIRKTEAEQARRAGADEIITVLAHDLRNHLQPLLGRVQTMRLRSEAGKAVSLAEVDGMLRSAQRLAKLTDDLLDLKRLDEGLFTLNLAPVDLTSLARETRGTFETSSFPVRVNGLPELRVIADAERLRQVLDNLVANAMKYAPAGSGVALNVGVQDASADARKAVVEVIDHGPGIAAELLPTLFDRYVKGARSHGLGLGLHLARHIAQLHGGALTVVTQAGVGTTFRLALPVEAI